MCAKALGEGRTPGGSSLQWVKPEDDELLENALNALRSSQGQALGKVALCALPPFHTNVPRQSNAIQEATRRVHAHTHSVSAVCVSVYVDAVNFSALIAANQHYNMKAWDDLFMG